VKRYLNKTAALKDAISHRNKMIPILERKSLIMPGEKESYTVDELFKMTPTYFPRTQGSYTKNEKIYNKYIKDRYAEVDIQKIGMEDVQNTLQLCASRCVQQQVRNVKTDWHRIYQVAIIKKIPVTDWTQVLDTPVSNKVTEKSISEQNITQEDFDRFCTAMSTYGAYCPWEDEKIYNRNILLLMLKFMRVTGLRPQEAKAIHRNDIQFSTIDYVDEVTHKEESIEMARVAVVKSIGSSLTEKLTEKTTKTPQSRRALPLFNEGVDLLKEVLSYSKHDCLFSDYKGKPFHTNYVSDYYSRVSRKCGIKVYAGLMRKAFSADNYSNGTNPAAIKKMMGHKNENMSVNWYATAGDEEVVRAMMNRKYKQ
jgi:integrase